MFHGWHENPTTSGDRSGDLLQQSLVVLVVDVGQSDRAPEESRSRRGRESRGVGGRTRRDSRVRAAQRPRAAGFAWRFAPVTSACRPARLSSGFAPWIGAPARWTYPPGKTGSPGRAHDCLGLTCRFPAHPTPPRPPRRFSSVAPQGAISNGVELQVVSALGESVGGPDGERLHDQPPSTLERRLRSGCDTPTGSVNPGAWRLSCRGPRGGIATPRF